MRRRSFFGLAKSSQSRPRHHFPHRTRDLRSRQLRCEPLEDRCLLSVSPYPELPGMTLVDPRPDQFEGQIIYLDFNGAADVTYNGPVVVEDIDVPGFEAPGELAGQEEQIIVDVVSQLEDTFARTGLIFTTDEPVPTDNYSTIFVGGDDEVFVEYGSFLGLAEQVDVGNRDASDNGFVFSDEIVFAQTDTDIFATALTAVIAHETGHLLGYEHLSDSTYQDTLAAVAWADIMADYEGGNQKVYWHYETVDPGSYSFEVDGAPACKAEWYKNNAFVDKTSHYADDPDYTFSFSSGTTTQIEASLLSYWNEDWLESHIWVITCVEPASLYRTPSSLDFGSSTTHKTFQVRNSGGGTLSYSVSDNKSWLSVSPTSGSSTGEYDTIDVYVSRSGLSPDDYSGTITIDPSVGSNQTISVSMSVLDTTDPGPVSNLGISGGSTWNDDNTPTFTWDDATDASGIKGYWWSIDDSSPTGGWQWLADTWAENP